MMNNASFFPFSVKRIPLYGAYDTIFLAASFFIILFTDGCLTSSFFANSETITSLCDNIITADPTATGILDHIQFAGYPLGARWEPGSGEVVPRLAGLAAPAPALSPVGVALGIAVLTALGLLALSRRRHPAA